jgi:hypothetical protein
MGTTNFEIMPDYNVIDESAEYEVKTDIEELLTYFQIGIDRKFRTIDHGRETPPEDVLKHENITVAFLAAVYEGEEMAISTAMQTKLEDELKNNLKTTT